MLAPFLIRTTILAAARRSVTISSVSFERTPSYSFTGAGAAGSAEAPFG